MTFIPLQELLQNSGCWKKTCFLRRGGDGPFSSSKLGSQSVFKSIFSTGWRDPSQVKSPIDYSIAWFYGIQATASDAGGIIAFRKHYRPAGSIVASWGLDVRRKLLLFYRNFGLMSPHPEELLQIYIILGPFASSRSETGEIPVILQDSLSGKVVHIKLLYLCRISLTE